MDFQPRGEGLYELVLVRHPATDKYHSAFETFPDLDIYPMKDLFSKHPSKPDHWLYMGRADDVIVLSNGEKLNPLSTEAKVREHLDVKGALVVGQGKFAPGLIVELQPEVAKLTQIAEDRARIVDSIWPYVSSANEKQPGHAQLAQDRILLAPQDKSLRQSRERHNIETGNNYHVQRRD